VLRVYVDNSLLSRIFDARISAETAAAIEELSEISQDSVFFVTAEQTLIEMMATSDVRRRAVLRMLFRLMSKVDTASSASVIPAAFGSAPFGGMGYGGFAFGTDPLLSSLQKIFAEAKPDGDPVHIFQAIRNGCDYFLTLDQSTILIPARTNFEALQSLGVTMRFTDPADLVAELRRREIASPSDA
jgi:hypothetical protein